MVEITTTESLHITVNVTPASVAGPKGDPGGILTAVSDGAGSISLSNGAEPAPGEISAEDMYVLKIGNGEYRIADVQARSEIAGIKTTVGSAQGERITLTDNSDAMIHRLSVTAAYVPANNGSPDAIIPIGVSSGISCTSPAGEVTGISGGPICAVPAPAGLESLANHTDSAGAKYISDVRRWSEGIDELHMARHAFNGGEDMALFYNTPGVFSCNNYLPACAGSDNNVQYMVQCSHYRAVTRGALYNNLSTIHETLDHCCGVRARQFVFVDSRFQTVNEFRAYLSAQYKAGTPVEIVYIPAETAEAPIPEREYSKFAVFQLPNGATVQGENPSNYLEMEYWKDFIGKSYTDQLMNRQTGPILEYVTPEDYGAVGNGIEYDDEAIAACLEFAAANAVPAKMYRNYRISQPIEIDNMDGVDVEINGIDYTGTDAAILLRDTRYAAVRVHSLASAARGIVIDAVSRFGCCNEIQLGSVTAAGNCIELIAESGKGLWQNRIDYRCLKAGSEAYCIHSRFAGTNSFVGENSYFGGQCAAGEWAFHINETDSKIYNPQLEGVQNGILLNNACRTSIYSPRYAELTTTTNGTVLKLVSDNYGSRFFGNEGFYLDNLSVDEASQGDKALSGAYLTTAPTYIDVPILKRTDPDILESGTPIARGAYVVGNQCVLIPMEKQRISVTGEFVPGETSFYLPDIFTINSAGCVITLPRSYCSLGHNDLVIDQSAAGASAAITDYHGQVIFDGAALGAGVYRLICASEGRRTYDDPNDSWTAYRMA